jgi:serine protease
MAATSVAFNRLPTNGETIYARLYSDFNGYWVHYDYTYTATSPAVLTGPAPSSTFAGRSTTFTWTSSSGATQYALYLGTTGVGSANLWDSGGTTATSVAFAGLPTNGETIYARLLTNYSGFWVHNDYIYTTASQATMISPAPGGTLPGVSATFTWSPGVGATEYSLWVGTTGVGSDNIYGSPNSTATSITVNKLPANGAPVYVRLYTNFNGSWAHADYTYTAQ